VITLAKKVSKAVADPALALHYLRYKVLGEFFRLDPKTVTRDQAEQFFFRSGNVELVRQISPFFEKATTIFDVGGNVGFFSREVLKTGYKGRLVIFEPIPHLMSLSVETLAEYTSQKLFINAALGEASGEIEMFFAKGSNIGWITAVKEKADNNETVKCAMVSTSDYIRGFRPEFIKIDVEGFELFVLRPLLTLIGDYRPAILCELGWGKSNPNWAEFLIVVEAFAAKGYKFLAADGSKRKMQLAEVAALTQTTDVLIVPEGC
jgi:FkbM family methyltransferase